jgi:hypothetical protein
MGQTSSQPGKAIGIITGLGLIPGWSGSYWAVGGTFGPASTGWGPEHPIPEDIKPNYSTRGTFLHYVLGRRQVGPIVAWIGDRVVDEITLEEAQAGGSGGDPVPAELGLIYTESAWHQLALGPAHKIHKIYADGEVIFEGPITRKTHPSGTEVDCGEQGTFKVYWGEQEQPVNTYLGSRLHPNLTINSRWPFLFYVVWKKFMGNRPVWPNIEYDIEVRPYNTGLSATKKWINGIWKEVLANSFAIDSTVEGPPGLAAVKINKNKKKYFKQGRLLTITGNTADGIYEILETSYNKATNKTTVLLNDSLVGPNSAGNVIQMQEVDGNGANPAHIIYHMLFNKAPHGLGLVPDIFDIQSLEAYGELADDEGLASSIWAKEGIEIKSILEAFMTEHSLAITQVGDYSTVVPIRTPNALDIPILDTNIVVPPLPEEVGDLDIDVQTSLVIFEYMNMNRNSRITPLKRKNDAVAARMSYSKASKVSVKTAVHHLVVARIADLMTPAIFNQLKGIKLFANRGSRDIFPGRVFTIPQSSRLLRCVGVRTEQLTGKVEIAALVDVQGLPKIDFVDEEDDLAPIPAGDDAEEDLG